MINDEAHAKAAELIEGVIPEAFTGDAHGYLMATYKDPTIDRYARMQAAIAAMPYEKPRLAAIEHKGEGGGPVLLTWLPPQQA